MRHVDDEGGHGRGAPPGSAIPVHSAASSPRCGPAGRYFPALYVGTSPRLHAVVTGTGRRRAPIRFLTARGGGDGLPMARHLGPRLAVVEGRLPDGDAAAFVTDLRTEVMAPPSHIVVLAHTGTTEERSRFLWAGASAYISTPSDSLQVRRTIGILAGVTAAP